jgi:hypothetical protein
MLSRPILGSCTAIPIATGLVCASPAFSVCSNSTNTFANIPRTKMAGR